MWLPPERALINRNPLRACFGLPASIPRTPQEQRRPGVDFISLSSGARGPLAVKSGGGGGGITLLHDQREEDGDTAGLDGPIPAHWRAPNRVAYATR